MRELKFSRKRKGTSGTSGRRSSRRSDLRFESERRGKHHKGDTVSQTCEYCRTAVLDRRDYSGLCRGGFSCACLWIQGQQYRGIYGTGA